MRHFQPHKGSRYPVFLWGILHFEAPPLDDSPKMSVWWHVTRVSRFSACTVTWIIFSLRGPEESADHHGDSPQAHSLAISELLTLTWLSADWWLYQLIRDLISWLVTRSADSGLNKLIGDTKQLTVNTTRWSYNSLWGITKMSPRKYWVWFWTPLREVSAFEPDSEVTYS